MVDYLDGKKETKSELSKEKIKSLELKPIEEVLQYGSSVETLKTYIERQEHINSLKTKIVENELKRYLVKPNEEMERDGKCYTIKVNGKNLGIIEIPLSKLDSDYDRIWYTEIMRVIDFKSIMAAAGKKCFSHAFQNNDTELFINAFSYINEIGGTYKYGNFDTIKIKIPKK